MKYARLLAQMIAKELRTMMRERGQMIGLMISALVPIIVMLVVSYNVASEEMPKDSAPQNIAIDTVIETDTEAVQNLTPSAPSDHVGDDVSDAQPQDLQTKEPEDLPIEEGADPTSDAPDPNAHGSDSPLAEASTEQLPAEPSHHELTAQRWVGIIMGCAIGMFFAMGYLTAATLATFVGEKDSRTLEVLLAAPIGDTTLFLLKCGSVLLPAVGIGVAVMLLGGAAAAILIPPLHTAEVPVFAYALLGSIPLLVLVDMVLLGIGAAISVKAQSMKGAGHLFGIVVMLLFFGVGYGVPLLVSNTPLGPSLKTLGLAWLELSFIAQYVVILGVLAVPAIILPALARSLFHRDRLLA
jgi:ABC-type Na+ efflux pump permease subunit